ncbi:hypothetical protein FOA52_002634 [Chlamydomonas sp. UWO 241]|nr:hypothetical protein FOA52_002634 [Chlamydomonas sp. UWO 241]
MADDDAAAAPVSLAPTARSKLPLMTSYQSIKKLGSDPNALRPWRTAISLHFILGEHMNNILEYADGVGPEDEYPVRAHDKHAHAIMLICMEQTQCDTYEPRFPTAVAMWRSLGLVLKKHCLQNKLKSMALLVDLKQQPRESIELYINRASGSRTCYDVARLMISHGGVDGLGMDLESTTALLMNAEEKVVKSVGSVSYVASGSASRRHDDRNGGNWRNDHPSGSSSSSNRNSRPLTDKSLSECYGCHEKGHFRSQCPNKSKWSAADREKYGSLDRDRPRRTDTPSLACITTGWTSSYPPHDPSIFLIDSAATAHIVYAADIVDDYVPVSSPTFLDTADKSKPGFEIKGYGTLIVETLVSGERKQIKLLDVHVAATVKANLLLTLQHVRCAQAVWASWELRRALRQLGFHIDAIFLETAHKAGLKAWMRAAFRRSYAR